MSIDWHVATLVASAFVAFASCYPAGRKIPVQELIMTIAWGLATISAMVK